MFNKSFEGTDPCLTKDSEVMDSYSAIYFEARCSF
jgi:hypothetical protein